MAKCFMLLFLSVLLLSATVKAPLESAGGKIEEPTPEQLISEGGNIQNLDSNRYFNQIVAAGRENDLSDTQINSLNTANLQHLTNPDAMRRVSAENIRHLSGDQLSQVGPDTLSDVQLRSLTQEQLLTNNNFDSVPDKSKLDPNVLNQVLSQKSRTPVQIQTQGNPTSGRLLPTGFQFASIPFIQVQTIKITNGEDVRFENNRVKAKKADQLEYKGSLSKKVTVLEADSVRLYVGKADELVAGCFAASNISNSSIVLNQSELVLNGDGASINYGVNKSFEYRGVGENSFIAANMTACAADYSARGQSYAVAAARIISTPAETIQINSTGFVNASPEFGVYCVFLSPHSRYDFREHDFGIQAVGFHQVCVRRSEQQSFTRDCSSCSVVDLLSSTVSIKGDVSYVRGEPVFTSTSGSAVLDFNDPFTDVSIETDSPDYITRINEQTWIVERTIGNVTHRLLGINASVQSVTGFVGNYSVFYDDGSLHVDDAVINYSTNDGFEVVVLPPGIKPELLAAMSIVGLLSVWRKRKGQLSLYILVGVIVVGIVLLLAGIGARTTQTQRVLSDKLQIQNYLNSCFERAADDALVSFGKQPDVFSKEQVKARLADESAELFASCAKGMSVSGSVAFAPKPEIDVLLAEEDVVFTANYPVVVRGPEEISVSSFTTTRTVRLKRLLEVARVLRSQDLFDISTARTPDASLLFYVEDGIVFSRITDRRARINNRLYDLILTVR